MFSYFVWLIDKEGDLHRLNICTGTKPEQLQTDMKKFWKAVEVRLLQLHNPLKIKDVSLFTIAIDPSHLDPITVTMEEAAKLEKAGAWKLAGEYPGRANYDLGKLS